MAGTFSKLRKWESRQYARFAWPRVRSVLIDKLHQKSGRSSDLYMIAHSEWTQEHFHWQLRILEVTYDQSKEVWANTLSCALS